YWVDYWLQRYFPAGTNQHLLNFTNSNASQIEVLPVLNSDGSVVIMVSNHAVAAATDNNGAGLTGNITIDTSALGGFTSATELLGQLAAYLAADHAFYVRHELRIGGSAGNKERNAGAVTAQASHL